MDERGANIDLLFRNGLKDYEVLPPPEVWGKINPLVKKTSRPVVILKAAAIIAAVTSISFLAYMAGRENTEKLSDTIASFIIAESSPLQFSATDPVTTPVFKDRLQSSITTSQVSEASQENDSMNDNQFDSTTPAKVGDLTSIPEVVSGNREYFLANSDRNQDTREEGSFNISTPDPVFYPEIKPVIGEKWSIAAMASPTYYSRFSSQNSDNVNQLMASEQSIVSYTGGFAVSYKINKRFSIQTGLLYATMGQKVDGINSFGGFHKYFESKGTHNFAVVTSSGSVLTSNPDVYLLADGSGERVLTEYNRDVFDPMKANLQYIDNNIIQNFSYIQLPVVLRYKIIDRSVDFNLSGGVSYDMLIDNSVYSGIDGDKYPIGTTNGLNPFTITSSFGMGLEYSLSKKMSLNLEPTFRYYLNPFNGSSGLKVHPYSIGVFSGFSYKF
jgi:hypothetical protein